MQAPPNSGSMYYNYKKQFSIVLLAVADAHYKFVMVDIGAYGQQSDGSVFAHSTFAKLMMQGRLDLPPNRPLRGEQEPVPLVFVGDEAFPLKRHLLRPFPGSDLGPSSRIYNFRLSHARRVVENAFGIMVSRFRVFRRPIAVSAERAESIVKACTVLHNLLRDEYGATESGSSDLDTHEFVATDPALQPLGRRSGREAVEAMEVRTAFMRYFNSPQGSLPWQEERVNRVS